jgi:hypothetical protein
MPRRKGGDRVVEHDNLMHAIVNRCTDPDCEIHNPQVGREEGTVSDTNLAFYIAGAYWGADIARDMLGGLNPTIHDELRNNLRHFVDALSD